jgi:hypothetical protein
VGHGRGDGRGQPGSSTGLQQAARRFCRRDGLVIGALDDTGQEKAGTVTAGV